jgi:hypothetical protein
LRETHVRGMCRNIKLPSLRDESEDCGIPNFRQPFCAHIEEGWRPEVCGLMLRSDKNVHIESTLNKLLNGLLYYRQPFHNPTSVEPLGLNYKV